MSFRPTFDCLWCAAPHVTRSASDIEGWAQLCPACVGRAGENQFLGFKLRQALTERSRADVSPVPPAQPGGARPVSVAQPDGASLAPLATAAPPASLPPPPSLPSPIVAPVESPDDVDDRYLRRGRFARGPIHDAAWDAELDAAGRWLDALPMAGEIVELAAGTGWWSALLAGKGTLSVYDESPTRLDRARDRLVAHRLRAHLHVRDRWVEPDRPVDALFVGPGIAEVPAVRLAPFAALAHRWLKPGGLLALIDLLPDALVDAGGAVAAPAQAGPVHQPGALPAALQAAGFTAVRAEATGRFFALVRATA